VDGGEAATKLIAELADIDNDSSNYYKEEMAFLKLDGIAKNEMGREGDHH
jgi:hypothetical protein